MSSNLDRRIRESFSDDSSATREHVLAYLNMLREGMSERAHGMRRSITFALAAVSLFVLLQTELTAKLSLGPFEFLKNSPLSTFLTAAVAYFFLDASVKASEVDRLFSAFRLAFQQWNEKAYDNDLEMLLAPDLPIYFAPGVRIPTTQNVTQHDKVYIITRTILLVLVVITPIAFQCYAFGHMLSSFGAAYFMVWLNLGIVTALTLFAYWILLSDN